MSFSVKFRLANGREIETRRYCVADSNDAVSLFIAPSEQRIHALISDAEQDATRFFGNYPVITIRPKITTDSENRPILPPVRIIAKFNSEPIDDAIGFKSTAIVIWYQHTEYPIADDDIQEEIRQIDWEKRASDSWFAI